MVRKREEGLKRMYERKKIRKSKGSIKAGGMMYE